MRSFKLTRATAWIYSFVFFSSFCLSLSLSLCIRKNIRKCKLLSAYKLLRSHSQFVSFNLNFTIAMKAFILIKRKEKLCGDIKFFCKLLIHDSLLNSIHLFFLIGSGSRVLSKSFNWSDCKNCENEEKVFNSQKISQKLSEKIQF